MAPSKIKENLLVSTKFYWSWTAGPVLIVRTADDNTCQGFCWLFWELPPNLNWEILSTKYESEMHLGNNKQNNFAVQFISLNYSIMFAVQFISLNYSIMYLSFLFLNLSTTVLRSLSDSLSFPSMDSLIRASKFLWINLDLRAWQRSFNQFHIYMKSSFPQRQ